jgi:hypothetical protein
MLDVLDFLSLLSPFLPAIGIVIMYRFYLRGKLKQLGQNRSRRMRISLLIIALISPITSLVTMLSKSVYLATYGDFIAAMLMGGFALAYVAFELVKYRPEHPSAKTKGK